MQDRAKCLSCPLANHLVAHLLTKFLQAHLYDLQVTVAFGDVMFETVEGLQNSLLHLGSSLVGKGYGKGVLEFLAAFAQ